MSGAATPVEAYGTRLRRAIGERGHLCLGIDPHPALLDAWGLPRSADGLRRFSELVLDAGGDLAATIKPQVAFFEAYGPAGMQVLADVCVAAGERGALVVADAKRGDIGSTLAAYAQAWLAADSPFHCDAVTLSPYLGVGALEPAFAEAERSGRGVYVLSATSNPEALALQGASLSALGRQGGDLHGGGPARRDTVAQHVADAVAARNRATASADAEGPGGTAGGAEPSFGLVVGATVEHPPRIGREHGPLLVPGYGAQGGTNDDVLRVCGANADTSVVNVSRAILRHGPDVAALRAATNDVNQQLGALGKSR